jgi:hypothetical protein
MNKTKATFLVLSLGVATALTACSSDADVASDNISTAADNFEINRRIVFYNSVTDKYILVVEGFCSVEKNVDKNQLEITCKVGDEKSSEEFKKNYLGLADNTAWFAEQLAFSKQNTNHYRVNFKPEVIIPTIVGN